MELQETSSRWNMKQSWKRTKLEDSFPDFKTYYEKKKTMKLQ